MNYQTLRHNYCKVIKIGEYVMDIYKIEEELKIKINDSADDVIRFALLETIPPIADYSFVIAVLKQNYSRYRDFRMAVLITFFISAWENYRENDFVIELNSFLDNADDEQRAVIYYLNAYDIFMHNKIMYRKNEYIEFLSKSVDLDTTFVYNYYHLAQISDRKKSIKLMKKALTNIERVYSDDECENLQIYDLISYDMFLKEHILGTNITQMNYREIRNFNYRKIQGCLFY